MTLATVGPEEFWHVHRVVQWLSVAVMAVFLLAAIRMWQGAPDRPSLLMGIGFGLLLVAKIYDGALEAGMIPMTYFPGYAQIHTALGITMPAFEWWEPLLWWGQWAARLCGWSLAGFGFLSSGRRIVREARERQLQSLPPDEGHVR